MATLSKQDIITALERLGEMAETKSLQIELLVVGGAAMVLLYNARLSTQDVDVLIRSPKSAESVRELAKQVANEYDFPSDWLNDAAKGYLIGISQGETVLSAPGIVVKCPSIEQLLAMKLSAWRDDVDISDARRLLQALTGTKQEIWEAIQPFLVPRLELKAQYAFLDLWETEHGTD